MAALATQAEWGNGQFFDSIGGPGLRSYPASSHVATRRFPLRLRRRKQGADLLM